MSLTFVYGQKIDFSICINMVGFPKYNHILACNALQLVALTGHGLLYLKIITHLLMPRE